MVSRVFKRSFFKTRVGTADGEVIGESACWSAPSPLRERGKVRPAPSARSREWVCLPTGYAAGDAIRVVAVEGSYLKVARLEEVGKMDMNAGFIVVVLACWSLSP